MAKSKKSTKKPQVKVQDLRATKNPKGGASIKEGTITHRKAGKGQQEFLVIKMNDVKVSG